MDHIERVIEELAQEGFVGKVEIFLTEGVWTVRMVDEKGMTLLDPRGEGTSLSFKREGIYGMQHAISDLNVACRPA